MEIKLTPQESEKYFHNSLCNSLNYMRGYGLLIDYNKEEYKIAKESLGGQPCYEDVLMEILRKGGKLTLIDKESDGEYTRSITLKEIHERVQQTDPNHLIDMISENDDATTGDCILQTVFFEDIIFG